MNRSSQSPLATIAANRLAAIRQGKSQSTERTLVEASCLDFIPRVTPRWERPDHLAAIGDLFDRAARGPVFALVSVPPQHGKSETILHGLAQYLLRFPHRTNAYASYAIEFAEERSRPLLSYAERAGVAIDPKHQRGSGWQTKAGGGFYATGVGGQITGRPVSGIFVIDDPHKNRTEAESAAQRDRVYDLFSSVALSRLHPTTSVIIVHTRWHEDDLIGRLTEQAHHEHGFKWEVINLPAINDGSDPNRAVGDPLWPKHRPLDFFQRIRDAGLTDYDWESMYMGRPRPRGGAVFHGVTYYDALPASYRIGKGGDFAYTESTRADHSAGVVLLESAGTYYVVDVRCAQLELDKFIPHLAKQSRVFPGRYRFYSSSTEKGIGQVSKLFGDSGVSIFPIITPADKFVRAQKLATMWNRGRVLLPSPKACAQLRTMGLDPSWVDDFKREFERFTGVSDKRDDQVDAAAAAFDEIPRYATTALPPVMTYDSPLNG